MGVSCKCANIQKEQVQHAQVARGDANVLVARRHGFEILRFRFGTNNGEEDSDGTEVGCQVFARDPVGLTSGFLHAMNRRFSRYRSAGFNPYSSRAEGTVDSFSAVHMRKESAE